MSLGFNGAALFRARRSCATKVVAVTDDAASTGPRSFERGDIVYQLAIPKPSQVASTGPRSFERGDRQAIDIAEKARVASTGPRSFERGD